MDGVKVFSATRGRERSELGERVTDWLMNEPDLREIELQVSQSSSADFHCLTIIVFYERQANGRGSLER